MACHLCAIPVPARHLCSRCAASRPVVAQTVAVFTMDGPIRTAIHRLKYEDLRALGDVLGGLLAAHPRIRRMNVDTVFPILIHRSTLRRRGFNHAELIARRVARELGVTLGQNALRKVRDTPRQVEVGGEAARRRNRAGAT